MNNRMIKKERKKIAAPRVVEGGTEERRGNPSEEAELSRRVVGLLVVFLVEFQ